MQRTFRKYHRFLAPIIMLPLALTVLTGMLVTMNQEWPLGTGIPSSLLLKIHTGEIFGLGGIYPMLNGLGMLGLAVTGITMTGLFRQKRKPSPKG
jgi:hypothetical protein